jgi:hypothetical protein
LSARDLLLPLFLLGCRHPAEPRPAADDASAAAVPPSLTNLRLGARETLDANCAECHTRGLRTALPRALRVFDLTENDWSRRMTDDQLREAARRLREPSAPTQAASEVRAIHVSSEELARFELFVAKELEARRDGGAR